MNIDLSSDESREETACALAMRGAGVCALTLQGANILKSGTNYPGVYAPDRAGSKLTIKGTGGGNGAGIGAGGRQYFKSTPEPTFVKIVSAG